MWGIVVRRFVPLAPMTQWVCWGVWVVMVCVSSVQQHQLTVPLATATQPIPTSTRQALMVLVWLDVLSSTMQIPISCPSYVLVVCPLVGVVRMLWVVYLVLMVSTITWAIVRVLVQLAPLSPTMQPISVIHVIVSVLSVLVPLTIVLVVRLMLHCIMEHVLLPVLLPLSLTMANVVLVIIVVKPVTLCTPTAQAVWVIVVCLYFTKTHASEPAHNSTMRIEPMECAWIAQPWTLGVLIVWVVPLVIAVMLIMCFWTMCAMLQPL